MAVLLGALATARGAAQTVAGQVLDDSTRDSLAAAQVWLVDLQGRLVQQALSGNDGRFQIQAPPGRYRLRVGRLGYAVGTWPPFVLAHGEKLTVELGLSKRAVALAPVTVPGRAGEAQIPYLVDAGFYRRKQQGIGYFLTRPQIEAHGPTVITDVLHGIPGVRIACHTPGQCDVLMPGASMMFIRGTCYPTIVLDGVVVRVGGIPHSRAMTSMSSGKIRAIAPPPAAASSLDNSNLLDTILDPNQIEALEVYPSPAGVPVQYAGYMSPCGAILAWSRR